MRDRQFMLICIVALLVADVALLMVNHKYSKELEEMESKPLNLEDAANTVRKILDEHDDEDDEDNNDLQAERSRRRQRRKEHAYARLAIHALNERGFKEGRQKAMQGREALMPFLANVNTSYKQLFELIAKENNKIAARRVDRKTPGYLSKAQEEKEKAAEHQAKIREESFDLVIRLENTELDVVTEKARKEYLAALQELRSTYNDESIGYKERYSIRQKATSLGYDFAVKLNQQLPQGFLVEKESLTTAGAALFFFCSDYHSGD